jgi:Astacin (Peptidase family M12A)
MRMKFSRQLPLVPSTAVMALGLSSLLLSHSAGPAEERPDALAPACLFQTAKPRVVRIFDPRLEVDRLQYAPINGRVIIEGDIDLGSPDEVQKSFAAYTATWADDALKIKDVRAELTEEQQKLLGRVAKDGAAANVSEAGEALNLLENLRRKEDQREFREHSATIRAGRYNEYRWLGGFIPYEIDPRYRTPDLVRKAIDDWHAKTDCIHFVPRNEQNQGRYGNWVRFVPSDGCSSLVGKRPDKGEQQINLAPGCGLPQIIHEMGHCVGLFHEQSRNDRDKYLRVRLNNVKEDTSFNFDLIGLQGEDVGEFDFKSIMLYPSKAFSANGKATMVRRDDENDVKFGIATGALGGVTTELSEGDVQGIRHMYPKPANPMP